MRHHLLTAYTRSLLAVLVSQFSHKRFAGSTAAVISLTERSIPIQVCLFDWSGMISLFALRQLLWADQLACSPSQHAQLFLAVRRVPHSVTISHMHRIWQGY